MSSETSAQALLERNFLEIRSKLISLAAELDRIDRAEGEVHDSPQHAQIIKALTILQTETDTDRAAKLQLLFSREYDPNWKQTFDMPGQ